MLIDVWDGMNVWLWCCHNESQAALLPPAGEQGDCNMAADGKLNTSNLKMVLGFY